MGEKVVDRGPARYFLSLLHKTSPLVEEQMDLGESLFEQPKAVTDSGGEQLGSSESKDEKYLVKRVQKDVKTLQQALETKYNESESLRQMIKMREEVV